jgi:signal transduction histidine kinase
MRRRVTAVATLVVVLVLVAASVALVLIQRRLLTDNLDDALRQRAADLAAEISQDRIPATAGGDDDTFVQVVAPGGDVVAASRNVADLPPLPAPADGGVVLREMGDLPLDDGPFRVVSRRALRYVVHVGASTDDVGDGVQALVTALLVAVPATAVVLAGLLWWLVGRTQRPVEAAARRQQQFVADASHELRTPLARIRSELEVDAAHPGDADADATRRSVLEEVAGLQRLVDDLLHLARTDAGNATLRRQAVDLDDIVLEDADRLRSDGRVRVDVAGVSAAQVRGDRDQLARVVRNLTDNAVRHARSAVTLSLAEQDGTAVLSVADDGPGIPADQRDAVFERFTRLDGARAAASGGAGLGLAIARDIVERHGGSVAIDPEHSPGTRFVVIVPRA